MRMVVALGLAAVLGGLPTVVRAEEAPPSRTVAEIRIELPDDAEPRVVVEPEERRVHVEIPRGSVFPLDFAESTGGLLRAGKVTPVGQDRVALDLELAVGLFDRVTLEPRAVVLRFTSRFEVTRGGEAGADEYRVGPDDRISITVHGRPELSTTLTVADDGTVTAPLVGEIDAAGRTTRQIAATLAERLGRSYLVDPQVDVDVAEYRSQWVMVTGEVRIPSRVFLRGGTRLKEVLSEAGGFTTSSGQEIVISRRVGDGEQWATETLFRREFESGTRDPLLRHGDIIEIPPSDYCFVQGEVRSPSRVPIERGLTLLQALTMVGGLTEWADRKQVRILHPDGSERVVNLKRIQEGQADDPPLQGGEVVYVKRRFF